MKKNIILSIMLALLTLTVWGQQPRTDQRTTNTKIADLLMQLPAQNSADNDRIMRELSDIGEPVILNAAQNLVAPGKGNDTPFRYAISGLVKYSSKNKALANQLSGALCKALAANNDNEVKDFLLQELQYVANDQAVQSVSPLLVHTRLSDPASRVMVRINSESSGNALLQALTQAGDAQKVFLVMALGEIAYAPASGEIQKAVLSNNKELKKVALRALAEIGNPSSVALLAREAANAGYLYNDAEATASYFKLLQTLIDNGNGKTALKPLKKIAFNKSLPVAARSTSLSLLTGIPGYSATKDLMKAQKDADKEFRTAAQNLLSQNYSPALASTFRKNLQKERDPEKQAELIWFLARHNDVQAHPQFMKLLNSNNKTVQLPAIQAVASVNPTSFVNPMAAKSLTAETINALTHLILTGDETVIEAAKNALLTIEGADVTMAASESLKNATGPAAIALIDIISGRRDGRYAPLIFTKAESPDLKIREAAAAALTGLAVKGDETKISALLNRAKSENEVRSLQQALFEVIKPDRTSDEQVALVADMMKKTGSVSSNYYGVLAMIGGPKGVEIIENDIVRGSDAQKETALKALANWNDSSALPFLLSAGKSYPAGNLRNLAITSYISGINRSTEPADQKVLMFRKAMDMAATNAQKQMILGQVARNATLQSLAFVSKYLNNPDLAQNAVNAVRSIVQSNPALHGPMVTEIVHKAISLNKDPEAEYQKNALMTHLASLPSEGGFVSMFNGKNLDGWKGLVENPIARAKMTPEELREGQQKADERMRRDWFVENGILVFEGEGYDNLCSEKMYGDFELVLDWRMEAKGDGGVYLRGTPQVQTWDTSRVEAGAQVGSGGLYNNQIHRSKPLVVADNPINEWNTFRIKMIGDKVTVHLNGQLVTDNVILENYWDRKIPVFEEESIELQAHGTRLEFRDIFVREIPRPKPYTLNEEEQSQGFVPLFNGIDLTGWTGNKIDYFAQEGMIVCQPSGQGSGNLFTEKEYADFIMRFEFQLTPGANNGLGIRAPLSGDAAYQGMELQILDNEAPIYNNLKPWQYHGSVYGVIASKRGYLNPVGEWNYQEVKAIGNQITITLNGHVILDGNIAEASNNNTQTIDGRVHPGLLNKSGHIGFLGHGSPLKFRNLRIKDLGN